MLGRAFYHGSQNELVVSFGSMHWFLAQGILPNTDPAFSIIDTSICGKKKNCFLKKGVNAPLHIFLKYTWDFITILHQN